MNALRFTTKMSVAATVALSCHMVCDAVALAYSAQASPYYRITVLPSHQRVAFIPQRLPHNPSTTAAHVSWSTEVTSNTNT